MANFRLAVPERAKRGEVVQIRTLIAHQMDNGYQYDANGFRIPRKILNTFFVTYNGVEVFRANMHPAQAANPFFEFYTIATESGELVFTWIDDDGTVITGTKSIAVA